ncbi:MAG: pentapeptide repeat-containing protein [Gammaproteobacteria bacterium]
MRWFIRWLIIGDGQYFFERVGFIFLLGVTIGGFPVVIYFYWDWLSQDLPNGDALRNIVLSFGGMWAIYAIFLAALRVRIMQQQQLSESLAKAAEQLSSNVPSIRILAIRTLKNIALNVSDADVFQDVVSVLCHYIRDRGLTQEPQLDLGTMPASNIEEAVRALSAINTKRHAEAEVLILFKANLSGLELSSVNLSGANLSSVNLSSADLRSANLSGAKLLLADLSKAQLSEVNLSSADLSGANLSGTDLFEAKLVQSDLSGANLSGADLSEADLSETNLRVTGLSGACLLNANLSGANLSGTDLSQAKLIDSNLTNANLSGAELCSVDLSKAKLIDSNLTNANLSGARLLNANLSGANLSKTNLTYANLTGAKLSGADLSHADVTSIYVDLTDFKDACLDKVRGFSPNVDRWETAVNLPPEVTDRIIQYKKENDL